MWDLKIKEGKLRKGNYRAELRHEDALIVIIEG